MQRYRIESLLSARLFLAPEVVGDHLYFISDLSGRLSLYVMQVGGSVPLPLIPPDIALPNPHHFDGLPVFRVLPKLGKILLMVDQDGDENYQPSFVPIDGGRPEPIFEERYAGQQLICHHCDVDRQLALFGIDPRTTPMHCTILVNLATLETRVIGESVYGSVPVTHDVDFTTVLLADQYTFGDVVYFLRRVDENERTVLFGTPIDDRNREDDQPPNGLGAAAFTAGNGLLFISAIFDDYYGLTYFPLDNPQAIQPIVVDELVHTGEGELVRLDHRGDDRYILSYDIDGVSWAYEGVFDEQSLRFFVERVLVGVGELVDGVLESLSYEKESGRYAISFSTTTSPSQLYLLEPDGMVRRQTDERVLGIPSSVLAAGEEHAYISHDGLRISARLYLPASELGYSGQRPVIFYIHGGPQSQERPDFTWFSMPLIQFLTLNGFAVWVPNVRGSSGYGMAYMKHVDRDRGGDDRLDHVAAFDLLRKDSRLDMTRVGVMGRSYGGYMTLTLVGRHPKLWGAAVDMFGPYDLFTFIDRLPETWKTYFYLAVGHPDQDRAFLAERSPSTYLSNLACPLMVIQGANDPRVVERESRDLVERLRAESKDVAYIVYEDEGHDVIRYVNKVDCYSRIVDFFTTKLGK